MTALETLKCYTHGKKNTDKVEISVWALNRIINALSQEPCDTVSRGTCFTCKFNSRSRDDYYSPCYTCRKVFSNWSNKAESEE